MSLRAYPKCSVICIECRHLSLFRWSIALGSRSSSCVVRFLNYRINGTKWHLKNVPHSIVHNSKVKHPDYWRADYWGTTVVVGRYLHFLIGRCNLKAIIEKKNHLFISVPCWLSQQSKKLLINIIYINKFFLSKLAIRSLFFAGSRTS